MKNIIFESWHQWKVCFISGCKNASWGIWRIITCIILGIVSLFIYAGKQIEAFCRRETIAAFIIAILVIVLSYGWISTFIDGKMKIKSAEYQRDSISVKLERYLQAYDSTSTIVVDNDTIR